MIIQYFTSCQSNKTAVKVYLLEVITSGGSKGMRGMHTPPGPNSLNFTPFLGKYGKIVCWCPPEELAPPPRGNPGSATDHLKLYRQRAEKNLHNNFLSVQDTNYWNSLPDNVVQAPNIKTFKSRLDQYWKEYEGNTNSEFRM